MKRFALALGVILATFVSVAPGAVAPGSVEHSCKTGLRHAVVGGRHMCLKTGDRCAKKHDHQYHRFGFHCHGRRLTNARSNLTFPVRAAFYYPWFPETWTVRGRHVRYNPSLGYYDSSDAKVARAHIRQLQYGRIEAAIASWWGRGTHFESTRLPLLLDVTAALGSTPKWSIYYEREGSADPSVAELQSDLMYLSRYAAHASYARVAGKPVIFVYNANDSTCDVATRWTLAAARRWYVVLKVFPGYAGCANQPNSWHQYAPANADSNHSPHSYSISPGFWVANEPSARLARDVPRWRQSVRAMVASGARWQLVTTFNEWGEGTAVEHAREWMSPSGYGVYLDVLHATPAGR